MSVMEYLRNRLREAGPRRFAAISSETGVAPSLLPKLAYGMRDNPRIGTVQPLLDYFGAIDRGERELPAESRRDPEPAAHYAADLPIG